MIGKRSSIVARNQILMSGLNLGLNFLLVPLFGYVAAGLTTLVCYAGLVVLHARDSKPYFTWHFPWATAARASAATLVMGLVTAAVYGLSGGGLLHLSLDRLALSIAVAVPTYSVVLLALGEASSEEQAAAKRMLRRLTGAVSLPDSQ